MDYDEKDNKEKKLKDIGGDKKLSAKKQGEYVRFMFITIIMGVIICIVVFFAVFSSINSKKKTNQTILPTETDTSSSSTKSTEETTTSVSKNLDITAVILNISTDNNKIQLYNFEQDKEISLVMLAGAEMKDQYGNIMSLAEFKEGDVVQVTYNSNDMKFNSLKISSKSWQQKSVTGLKVDTKASTITAGNKIYKYNNKLAATYNGEDFDIAQLDAVDIATIKGYNDTMWSIELEKGHGFVVLSSKDKIKDGAIEIDTNIFKSLNEESRVKVREGSHKLVVKGSNIEPYTKQFIVSNAEEVTIDLSDVQFKSGVLIIKSNVTDYVLYVNGEQQISGEPLVLEFGKYTIKATKEDYNEVTAEVVIEQNTVEITLNMEEIEKVKMGELTVTTDTIEGADVYVDNVLVGITPFTIKLEYGEHRVTVKKEGYEDMSLYAPIGENPFRPNMILHPKISNQTTQPTTQASTQATTTEPTTSESSTITPTTISGGSNIDIKPIY